MNGIQKNHTYFFYPVSDKAAEKSYWEDAVNRANWERQKTNLTVHHDFWERVDRIIISQYFNPNNDVLMEDSTDLNVYANAERTQWCFMLENDHISDWDGWPVYCGGVITPEQFSEFMEKMNLKHHLSVFEATKI